MTPEEKARCVIDNNLRQSGWIIQDLDESFGDVSDRIKEIGGKQSFELCLNELEINEIVDGILLHENATESDKNEVYKLARLRNVQVEEIDFDKVCAPQASV